MRNADYSSGMKNEHKVFFVIPAYNEADNLDFLITNIDKFMHFFRYDFLILLVNDGSSDNTESVAKSYAKEVPIIVLNHETNLGPGKAFQTGFGEALTMAKDNDIVVTVEADNTSDLCVLNRMFEMYRRGNDLVLASVYGEGRIIGAPLHRRVLSWCANTLMKVLLRVSGVNTFTSFFRVHRVSMLRHATALYGDSLIEEEGFLCMLELLIKLQRLGYRITQVPMLLDSKVRIGDSKMKVVKNTKDAFRLIYKYCFREETMLINSRHGNST